VHEEVEGEEPFTFNQDTPLNETKIEGVQSESTPSFSSEKEFVISNVTHLLNLQKMCRGKTSKAMKGMASKLVDCYQRGGTRHRCIFGGAPKY
jgi:hypothetical protein